MVSLIAILKTNINKKCCNVLFYGPYVMGGVWYSRTIAYLKHSQANIHLGRLLVICYFMIFPICVTLPLDASSTENETARY